MLNFKITSYSTSFRNLMTSLVNASRCYLFIFFTKYNNFKAAATAEQHQEELDTFINGIASTCICRHVLNNQTLDLEIAQSQAYALD